MKKLFVAKSKIEGNGIYTAEPIKKGEHIAFITGKIRRKKIKDARDAQSIPLWYGLTDTLWIDPAETIWRFFNHSCEPNTAIIGTKKLIALVDIAKNTELTFDYSMTDADTFWEMKCSCGSRTCRKKIHSIQRIPERVYESHLPYIPKFFIRARKNFLNGSA
jgi:SET domain-containing protein